MTIAIKNGTILRPCRNGTCHERSVLELISGPRLAMNTYLLHIMRVGPSFIPELDAVAVHGSRIVGKHR